MKIIIILINTVLFISCSTKNDPVSPINENIIPASNIAFQTDSLNFIKITWDDLTENEVGYIIIKLNENNGNIDSINLPANSNSYYDNNVQIDFAYTYSIGVFNVNSILYSDPITIIFISNWIEYFEFLSMSDLGRFALSFSTDEKYIAEGFGGKIYSIVSKSLIKTLTPNQINLSCDFGIGNSLLLFKYLYNFSDGTIVTTYDIPYTVLGGKISNDGSLVGLITSDIFGGNGSVRIFNINGTIILNYLGGTFFNFSNTSQEFLFSPSLGYLSIINAYSGEVIKTKKISDGFIHDAVFSPNDEKIAIASYASKIILWNSINDELTEFETATGNKNYAGRVEFTPDGNYLICGLDSRNVSIWDIGTKQIVENVTTHDGSVYDIEISPSGKYLASYGGSKVKVHKNEGKWEIVK